MRIFDKKMKGVLDPSTPFIKWFLPLIFWGIYFFYPFLQFGDNPYFSFSYKEQLIDLLFEMGVVYSMYLFVIPRVIKMESPYRWWSFIFILSLLLLLAYPNCLLMHYISDCDCSIRICIFNRLLHYIFLIGMFTTFYLYKQFQEKKREIEVTKKEKYIAELEALKAQINPHFLFNTLNAIYSHTVVEDLNPKLSNTIFQFSEILRYTTYEGRQQEVKLYREIEHIENYVHLQLFRLEDKISVDFKKNIENDNLFIVPLLLINFVENAFKYTCDLKGNNHKIFIEIREKEQVLFFTCKNPYNYNFSKTKLKEGVGLSNTLRRLTLIYPDKHQFSINDSDGIFKVDLQIDLT